MLPPFSHPLQKPSAGDFAYARIRENIMSGRWRKTLPGTRTLAAELEVSRTNVLLAVRRLEKEGLIRPNGSQKARQLVRCERKRMTRSLEIGLFTQTALTEMAPETHLYLLSLLRNLEAAGDKCHLLPLPAPPTEKNNKRLIRWLEQQHVDAFIPYEFPEDLLRWLTTQPRPVFALGGAARRLCIAGAGMDYAPAIAEIIRKLFQLGHTRIVAIYPAWIRRMPRARTIEILREEFGKAGLSLGPYHLPEWEETKEGLRTLLESLFQVSPPTAIITRTSLVASGVMTFLFSQGLRVPQDVSLTTENPNETVSWGFPNGEICHASHASDLITQHCRKWVRNIARHQMAQNKYHLIPANLNLGTSLGPPPG